MKRTVGELIGVLWAVGVAAGWSLPASSQSISDCTVRVTASVQVVPPQIALSWPPLESATGYSVFRKSRDEANWGPAALLPGTATSFVDTDVTVGAAYEYQVFRTADNCNSHAYIYSGIAAPLVEKRGKVILIVDNSLASGLTAELAQLEQDLVGDGWTVLRHGVPRMAVDPSGLDPSLGPARSNEVAAVRNIIRADYLADPLNVKAVFLLGHVPVPYSGALVPDQHPDHIGAWPADAFYGDMDGTWTDSAVSQVTATDPRNRNVPGDGKFDQSHLPAPLALQVGRVDLVNLPALPYTELEALSRYLNKDHRFRHKLLNPRAVALVDDTFGNLNGELPAANGWANLTTLTGQTNVSTGRWLTDLTRADYLWSYGCGEGTYVGAAGVASTSHFLVYDIRVVFTMLFGSYFADWDSPNNFLRGCLAGGSATLSAAWTGRPDWYFHHMGLGETIGFSTRLSQNNAGSYEPNSRMNVLGLPPPRQLETSVHIALMGDPTLRLHPVAPPVSLMANTNAAGGVDLSWSPSSDEVLGYQIYRAHAAGGPYTALSATWSSATNYTDPAANSDRFYMVRAIKLQTSPSGTYYNASQGAFAMLLEPPSTTTNTWAAQGAGTWMIRDAVGEVGSNPGWDSLLLEGSLDVSATPSSRFTVRIISQASDGTPGPPANFDNNLAYSWRIVTATLGVAGFDPSKIHLLTDEFQGNLGGGVFGLALSDDSSAVNLVFTPNQPPIAQPAYYSREWDQPMRIAISDLLGRFTSDPDGDPRALLQVGSSTNGTAISTDGSTLVFSSNNNLSETVLYWVQDVREYRAGDTVRVARSTITIDPLPKGLHFDAYHAVELQWQGELGRLYQVQSRLETELQWTNQGDPVVGTGEKTSFFERASNVTKFYRIVAVQ